MHFFNLSLASRLGLAALSGILTFPAILLDSALGPESYPPFFSWWIVLHGLLFGVLVLAPFVSHDHLRGIRVVTLAIASVLIYDAAIRMPDIVAIELAGDLGDFVVAGISGSILAATAVRFIAPLDVTPYFWGYCLLAGLIGGLIFGQAFGVCDWDRCTPAWLVLPYVVGWIAWQSLVCVAMFLGTRRPDRWAAYGPSVR